MGALLFLRAEVAGLVNDAADGFIRERIARGLPDEALLLVPTGVGI